MKISIEAAAKLLGLSAHLLRWRVTHQHVLKFATRTPQTVLLADVLAYRDTCRVPLKKPGRRRRRLEVLDPGACLGLRGCGPGVHRQAQGSEAGP